MQGKDNGTLAPARGGGQVAPVDSFTADQVGLLKRTICQGATDDEFALFLGVCKRTGLDPFARQLQAVKRWDGKAGRNIMSIQIGIDGFRLIAERTGQYDGQDEPEFTYDEKGGLRACKVKVYRKGVNRPFVGVAFFTEYAQYTKERQLTQMWRDKPHIMLAKCSEALALRKAFPQDLSGLYAAEEMGAVSQPQAQQQDGCIKPADWAHIRDLLAKHQTPQRELLEYLEVDHPRDIRADMLPAVLELANLPRDQWGESAEPVGGDEGWGEDEPADQPAPAKGKATKGQLDRIAAEFRRAGIGHAEQAKLLARYGAETPADLFNLQAETLLVELRDLETAREPGQEG